MATKVIGSPVTDETVKMYFPDKEHISAKDRATVAMMRKNEDARDGNASRFVHKLKSRYGTGTSTLCVVYNGTGGDLKFDGKHTWAGEGKESPYPGVIKNGQWAAFPAGNSKEAVVYSGKNDDGVDCGWMLAWNTARLGFANRVYTAIHEVKYYEKPDWDYIDFLMEKHTNDDSYEWNGCKSTISIAEGASPELHANMTLSIATPTEVDDEK